MKAKQSIVEIDGRRALVLSHGDETKVLFYDRFDSGKKMVEAASDWARALGVEI